jgi:hypothetical protein
MMVLSDCYVTLAEWLSISVYGLIGGRRSSPTIYRMSPTETLAVWEHGVLRTGACPFVRLTDRIRWQVSLDVSCPSALYPDLSLAVCV